ncbi:helix-turn-helix domain-containing protein [Verticiella sediminum]|uniref:Helix-turn-helix domain-containing protein n=1 Tax=Verticiella sediminum TaxID=1247510 RepID=A0A556ABX1_9BURK|nr:helix-turn-helix domain-containing protein [Verticiella sediminum]TSH90373.1 helix-turn-helix domain-containing protein [Verticiella sediminum]
MAQPIQELIQEKRRTHPAFGGTIAKAFALLSCFGEDGLPLGNREFAQRLGMPRATVSRLCRTLVELGYLAWDRTQDKYVPSVGVLRLGYPYLVGLPLRNLARGPMQALAERIGGAVSIGVAQGTQVIYLETCTHREGTLALPAPGATRSVMTTAMGRAWLATLDADAFAQALDAVESERPQEHAAMLDTVKRNVALYPRRGYALNEGDAGLGVHGVGVASRLHYHQHRLLFNCAIAGERVASRALERVYAPALIGLVQQVEVTTGLAPTRHIP